MKKGFLLMSLLALLLCACKETLPNEESSAESVLESVAESESSVFAESSEPDWFSLPEDSFASTDEESSADESSWEEPALTVILDPGHGFGDVGCTFPDTGAYEKEIAMVLAHKIGAELQGYGINVLYTHDGETFPTGEELDGMAASAGIDYTDYLHDVITACSGLSPDEVQKNVQACLDGINQNRIFGGHERCYYANLLDAEQEIALFLSVHVNVNTDSDELKGFELYYCSEMPYADDSLLALQSMQSVLKERFDDRYARAIAYKWKDGNIVNKYVDMPSILLEAGYATTPSDAVDLQNEVWQNAFARAVADGIVAYLYRE